MALAGPPSEQTFGRNVSFSRESATSIEDMSRAGSVKLGARMVVEQSSLVNETHSRLRTSIQDQVWVAKKFWDHLGRKGVGKRRGKVS